MIRIRKTSVFPARSVWEPNPVHSLQRLAVGCAVVFGVSLAYTVSGKTSIEWVFLKWLNSFAVKNALLDYSMYSLVTYTTFSGAMLMAIIWYCWFASNSHGDRCLILAGSFSVFAAGGISRALQLVLPTHLRPLHDPALAFTPPLKVDPGVLSHWNSFPSDHAAVYFGMAMVAYLVRPRVGYLTFAIALILNLARVYTGFHFPSDVLGGGALGLLIVLALCRSPLVLSIGDRLVSYERSAPAFFYACAFLISYEMATLFEEVRSVFKGLLLVVEGHA